MDDAIHMRRAIALAARGLGRVEPNPPVGCVIVKRGRVIAEGWHRVFGGPHAEIHALRRAGTAARGATAYVSLEPCAHHGKTPPCTAALIEAGIARVVIGVKDPFPKVAGRGLRQLRRAGLDVEIGVEQDAARERIAAFSKRITTGLPWVICKWAQTLDGAIATTSGDSQWISNETSRREVHRLRARVDAILIGIGTAIADNPQLTARDVPIRRVARRVVIDPDLRLPANSRLLRTLEQAPLTLAVRQSSLDKRGTLRRRLEAAGVELWPWRGAMLNPEKLLRHLSATHHATNVLVEGGATTHGLLLEQHLVDEIRAFVAPKLLGHPGLSAVRGSREVRRMAEAHAMVLKTVRRFGDDLMLTYRPI